ncbi:MAG TPA: hypothetical protein VJI73_00400 [Candidatus Paceibacterota bacterium]
MSKDNKPPQSDKENNISTGNFSWLKDGEDPALKEGLRGFEIDPDSLPDITEEEFIKFLAEEKALRQILRKNGINGFDQTPQQIVAVAKTMNITESLLAWGEVHKRNRAYMRKRGGADIMITSTSQLIVEAAELLSKNEK